MNRPKEVRNPGKLQFLASAANLQGCPSDSRPEIAIVGRSNAGKSSIINALANARIALVSGTPGKTRLLNFYQAPQYRLVDMPGYGFASRSGTEQRTWRSMIESFLSSRGNLIGLLLVMDIRRDWTDDEYDLVSWLEPRDLPAAIVLTKADKMSRSVAMNRAKEIAKQSGAPDVFVTSALKKTGFKELEDFLFREWILSDGGRQ